MKGPQSTSIETTGHASGKQLLCDSQSTCSTVDCDMSMSFSEVEDVSLRCARSSRRVDDVSLRSARSSRSNHSRSSHHSRRKLQKSHSDETLNSSSRRSGHRRSRLRKTKSVHFACHEDGSIKAQEREFTIYLDRSCWYNRQDLLTIQDECCDIVDTVLANSGGKYTLQHLRGLERFILDDERDETAEGYRQLIIGGMQGLEFSDEKVREVCKVVCREALKMARRTAKFDTLEAIKAAMT